MEEYSNPADCLLANINKRRTFAIISHPDAGKTTLTEKFLLYGGAIQLAGQVKAKGDSRRAKSDFMKLEKDRGISVSASTMSFSYEKCWFNLVDTPGHSDFSEDTYRTITAVDSAIMVIDGAKGIESQTKKLFEICRLRDLPIITFCNKMDRESRDNFEIIDEIQEKLAIDVAPLSWPIGSGKDFIGCYDIINSRLEIMDRADRNIKANSVAIKGINDAVIEQYVPKDLIEKLKMELELAMGLLPQFNLKSFLDGTMSPILFGSAINSFGVVELMNVVKTHSPVPRQRSTHSRIVKPSEKKVSGFVFKVQANMDQRHRDRVAFVRLCSGKFIRGMKLNHVRSEKILTVSNPVLFMANDREVTNEAYAGDIIGIPNHGQLRLGDSLTEGEVLKFTGLPSFAPEILQSVISSDPMKSKHLEKALTQFAEEGSNKLFRPALGTGWIIGVVGALQFDVLKSRIKEEYNLPIKLSASSFTSARWLIGEKSALDKFVKNNISHIAYDHDGDLVFLTRLQWDIDRVKRDYPEITLKEIKELQT